MEVRNLSAPFSKSLDLKSYYLSSTVDYKISPTLLPYCSTGENKVTQGDRIILNGL